MPIYPFIERRGVEEDNISSSAWKCHTVTVTCHLHLTTMLATKMRYLESGFHAST